MRTDAEAKAQPRPLSLRAQGKAPRANYVIIPVAGSLFGNATFLRDDSERAQSVIDRMLANSGVKPHSTDHD